MKHTMKLISIALALLLAGCMPVLPGATRSATQTTPPPTPTATTASTASATATATQEPSGTTDEIRVLLPDKTGFVWQYSGFAEYAMTMELKSIDQANGILTYRCEGEVADMSDGEASGDFGVKTAYQVMPGVLRQSLAGEKALDNVYPDLELIRAPLEKGAKWVQAVQDSNGNETNLSCTIDDVKEADGRKVYFVTYRAEGTDYYEKREITEGMGITAFDRLYEFEDTSELIGYRLYLPGGQSPAAGWEQWLPTLDKEYTWFGLAEYGHKGKLVHLPGETVFEYRGIYQDGTGKDDKFVLRYHVDTARGTVTEQVISNERGKKEVNSKLHNLVILKFPLSATGSWSHAAKLNGRAVTVQAAVTEYDEAKGLIKVRYTAKGAEGYYDSTYIEERTFEKGYGMTGFGNLLPGSIGISAADAKDPKKLEDAIVQHMFGYSLNKQS